VVLMPAREAPHKRIDRDPGPEERYELCRVVAADNEWLDVSRQEIDRPGPSYTVETLRALAEATPKDELYFIVGSDQAASLPSWREPEEILRLATVGVGRRDGVGEEEVRSALAGLAGAYRMTFFRMPGIEVSSSEVRRRVSVGRPFRYLVPEPVAARIAELGLYRDESRS
jgi:nicotinate-nucleotide adenylyltransferase